MHTANHMHTRVKMFAKTLEGLEPATNRGILLQDDDLEAFLA